MKTFLISGGKPLFGTTAVGGAKNAALPVLFATALTGGKCYIGNLPDIGDVRLAFDILRHCGAEISMSHRHGYVVDTSAMTGRSCTEKMARGMRASVYLLGVQLGRFGYGKMCLPGGCDLGKRPIDQHLKAFTALGATVKVEDGMVEVSAKHLTGTDFTFDTVSVGATVNAIFAAVCADGKSILRGVSKEPHIEDVAAFLVRCGADIEGAGTDTLRICGGKPLHGCDYTVIADMMEAGTYLIAGVAAGGEVTVSGIEPLHLTCLTKQLRKAGAFVTEGKDTISVTRKNAILPLSLLTGPYPAFPTDLHPQMTACLSLAEGKSSVTETVWLDRFRYVEQLKRTGAALTVSENRVNISGVRGLHGAVMEAPDLRAGAAALTAALAAKGMSVIEGADMIERGYENVAGKLRELGAEIYER